MAQIRIFADDIFRGSRSEEEGRKHSGAFGKELDYALATGGVASGLEKFRVPPPPLKYEWGRVAWLGEDGRERGGLQYKVCQNPDPLPSEANKLFMPALNSGRASSNSLFILGISSW